MNPFNKKERDTLSAPSFPSQSSSSDTKHPVAARLPLKYWVLGLERREGDWFFHWVNPDKVGFSQRGQKATESLVDLRSEVTSAEVCERSFSGPGPMSSVCSICAAPTGPITRVLSSPCRRQKVPGGGIATPSASHSARDIVLADFLHVDCNSQVIHDVERFFWSLTETMPTGTIMPMTHWSRLSNVV